MKNFPFTDYDFYAYISSGFVLVVVVDYLFYNWSIASIQWGLPQVVAAIAIAYAVGQLLAGLSGYFLEDMLIVKWAGRSIKLLMGEKSNFPRRLRWLNRGYFEPLAQHVIRAVNLRANQCGVEAPHEDPFWLMFQSASDNERTLSRLSTFQNLYGLCRNLSFVGFVSAILFAYAAIARKNTTDAWLAIASIVFFVGLLSRYLKFYRSYSLELLTSFAYKDGCGPSK